MIVYDTANCRHEKIGGRLGIGREEIESFRDKFRRSLASFRRWAEEGKYGFLTLPDEETAVSDALEVLGKVPDDVDTLLHLGIGGSSLGPIAVQEALDNNLTPKRETPFKRIIIQENVDPEGFAARLGEFDPARTMVNVVSKSGGTIETLATLTVVLDKMKRALTAKQISERLVVCTENPQGILHRLADETGAHPIRLPGNVGGRFAVLTAVGLLPAAAMGIDPRELLAGASAMRKQCFEADSPADPCFSFALIPYLLAGRGVNIHVLFPYSDLLRGFAFWCKQLLAESLGKRLDRSGRIVHVGQTPLVSVGTVDQHSLLQLYMEGPADKLFTFFEIEEFRNDEALENLPHPKLEEKHKRDLTLGGLLNAELRGTAEALAGAGRPNATIRIPRLSPHTLGRLFYFFELSTAYAAELYDIDAFDQPGVEASKKLTLSYLRGEG
jgi:glucose-6-phosphate isomerase